MLLRRRDEVAERRRARQAVVGRDEHVWGGPPVVRGLTTLIGVAAAGFLVWLATQFDLGTTGEYWSAMRHPGGRRSPCSASPSSSAAGRSGARPRSVPASSFWPSCRR